MNYFKRYNEMPIDLSYQYPTYQKKNVEISIEMSTCRRKYHTFNI